MSKKSPSKKPRPRSFRCDTATFRLLCDLRAKFGVSESEAVNIAIQMAATGQAPQVIQPNHAATAELRKLLSTTERFAGDLKQARSAKWLDCFTDDEKRGRIEKAEAHLDHLIEKACAQADRVATLLRVAGALQEVDIDHLKGVVPLLRKQRGALKNQVHSTKAEQHADALHDMVRIHRLLHFLALIGVGEAGDLIKE